MKMRKMMTGTNWYSDIVKSLTNIPPAIAHYESELEQAKREVSLHGRLEKAASTLPGIVEQRFSQLQEIEAILTHLNRELRKLRTKHYKIYLENYQRALSSRDVEK